MVRSTVALGLILSALSAGVSSAAPSLSTSERLADRRYVVTGSRGYVIGSEEGRFPAMGFHTRGEMGGVWSAPLKLLDGVWWAVDGAWVGPATRFTARQGYVRMALPAPAGLRLLRTDFVPGGRRGALFGIRVRNTGAAARTVTLRLDAHSELMDAYPWGETTPSQSTVNGRDTAAFDGERLVFADGPRSAVVGAAARPLDGTTGPRFRGPQDPPVVCPATGDAPKRCDDTAYGRGAGGALRWRLTVPAHAARTLWAAVGGSQSGPEAARAELDRLLENPTTALRAKVANRKRLARHTAISLPGDGGLVRGFEWSKQNLEDAVQVATGLDVRDVDEGKAFPAPGPRVARIRFFAAGFPDYPWLFATDGEYTAFPAVAVGRFELVRDHLRALRDVSRAANRGSGKIVHEVVTDGSVYFGTNADKGNTDESVKFASAVALLWRWSGRADWLKDLYPDARAAVGYVTTKLDADGDLWPEGSGNVEREGMGEEKLDNAVYLYRALVDLAAMARAVGDKPTAAFAASRAAKMKLRFGRAWFMPRVPGFADSLDDPGDRKLMQRHWIGATPMESEPAPATRAQAIPSLRLRETRCYTGAWGLYHTGTPGCDPAVSSVKSERQVFSLNTAIMAVAEANFGRLAASRRYQRWNARLTSRPDEQPGAMPEIAPSYDYGRSIDKAWNERASVLQAWGTYGTVWPVVHHELGVAPDLGRRRLWVIPQIPPDRSYAAGRRIRAGRGSVDVEGSRRGKVYTTRVRTRGLKGTKERLGQILPPKTPVKLATLDGRRVKPRVRGVSRGREVSYATGGGRPHVLRIFAR
jgi:hypothetical protein